MITWEHPKLGKFIFEEYSGWKQRIFLDVFARFTYESVPNGISDKKADLVLRAWEPNELPNNKLIDMAVTCVTNIEILVTQGIEYLCNDIHGKGPDSGIWWRGSLDQIYEILDNKYSENVLESTGGFYELLGEPYIVVQEFAMGYTGYCAEIGFASPIDTSHGVSFLTDGTDIIGIGYNADVSPFGNK